MAQNDYMKKEVLRLLSMKPTWVAYQNNLLSNSFENFDVVSNVFFIAAKDLCCGYMVST